jgi:hypothetical protein
MNPTKTVMLITIIKNAESLSIIKANPFSRNGNSNCISTICLSDESISKHQIELNTIPLESNISE